MNKSDAIVVNNLVEQMVESQHKYVELLKTKQDQDINSVKSMWVQRYQSVVMDLELLCRKILEAEYMSPELKEFAQRYYHPAVKSAE